MSEIIYNILGLAILVLVVVFLIFSFSISKKKTFNNIIRVSKTKIVFTSVFLALFVIRMILALILSKSTIEIESEILCIILWTICTSREYVYLKNVKRIINHDFHIMPDFRDINDDNIIDVEFKEISYKNKDNN